MSVARPLHVHADLRKKDSQAIFYYDLEKGEMGFDNGCGQDIAPTFSHPVNENATKRELLHALSLAKALMRSEASRMDKGYSSGAFHDSAALELKGDGENVSDEEYVKTGKLTWNIWEYGAVSGYSDHETREVLRKALKAVEPQLKKHLDRLLNDPAHHAEAIAADLYLDEKIGEGGIAVIWKEGEKADEFIERMVNEAAFEGKEVDEGELMQAVLARIDELLQEGRELSPEQHEFWNEKEEEGEVERLNERNPLRARPKPSGK